MLLPDIQPLASADPTDVEHLLDAAFGRDRRSRTAYRIREGMSEIAPLSFAAFDQGRLIGTIQCWPVALAIDGQFAEPLVLVGPVAVAPDRQKGGVGRILMEAMLAEAEARGEDALVLIGDPSYYERFFGFSAAHTGGWETPGPVERHRLLARLAGGRLVGRSGLLGPRG